MRISKAQSLGEYSICLAVIILALTLMQVYVRRGLQGRYADIVDQTTAKVSSISQYEPYYVDEVYDVDQNKNTQLNVWGDGAQRANILQDEITQSGTSIEGINCYDD